MVQGKWGAVAAGLAFMMAWIGCGGMREPQLPEQADLTATVVPTMPAPVWNPTEAAALQDKEERNVTYCSVDGWDLKMDISYPAQFDGPASAVVYVHGGGWTQGSKEDVPAEVGDALRQAGFILVSLDYRLAPQHKWPAQIEDVKCAVRSLRAHAAQDLIDPARIGAWGGSAGGHLVSMLGVTDTSAGFDVGAYLDQSSRVQAVVDWFGPSDLTSLLADPKLSAISRDVFNTQPDDQETLGKASPVTYVTSDDPPFLIMQGDHDQTVPPSQSQELYDRLIAAGVPAALEIVRNAGHSFGPIGGPIQPDRLEIAAQTAAFFGQRLMP